MVGFHTGIAAGQATARRGAGKEYSQPSPLHARKKGKEWLCFGLPRVCSQAASCRPIPLCQQPSLAVNSTTPWLSLLALMCASGGTWGLMRGAVQGSLRSWWAARLWSSGREDYSIHWKELPFSRWLASTSSWFLTLLFISYSITMGGVDLQKCYHLLIQTVVLGARNGGRAKFFAAWGLCCWLTAPAEINAQNIVGQVRPWCTSSVLLLFHKAWI